MPAALALIVVTHNSASWLPSFVESWNAALRHAPQVQAAGVEMVAADAGSQDDTLALLARVAPQARIARCPNIGYGAAANRAAALTAAPWLLICNPDLTFPEEFAQDFLSPLAGPAASSKDESWPENAAIIGPRLQNADGTPQFSVGRFPGFLRLMTQHFRPRAQRAYVVPPPQRPCAVEWLTGACLLIRRQPFEAAGGFDPGFFMFQDEVDLMRRLAHAGQATWYDPRATVIHHAPTAHQAPAADRARWSTRSTQRYLAKHASFASLFMCNLYWALTRRVPLGDLFTRRQALLARATGPVDSAGASGVPPCPPR